MLPLEDQHVPDAGPGCGDRCQSQSGTYGSRGSRVRTRDSLSPSSSRLHLCQTSRRPRVPAACRSHHQHEKKGEPERLHASRRTPRRAGCPRRAAHSRAKHQQFASPSSLLSCSRCVSAPQTRNTASPSSTIVPHDRWMYHLHRYILKVYQFKWCLQLQLALAFSFSRKATQCDGGDGGAQL